MRAMITSLSSNPITNAIVVPAAGVLLSVDIQITSISLMCDKKCVHANVIKVNYIMEHNNVFYVKFVLSYKIMMTARNK